MKKGMVTKRDTSKINSFTDLNAWKEGHKLVLMVYKVTKGYPEEEKFGLVSQMRRCAVSVTSNIAEGFSRNSYKDKANLYTTSSGSTTELLNQIIISHGVRFISNQVKEELFNQTIVIHKILNGLIKKSRIIHNS